MFNSIELQLMRQSLDVITIVGKDAKTVASLQIKLEQAIKDEKQKDFDLETLSLQSSKTK
jgi:hypothetical protein